MLFFLLWPSGGGHESIDAGLMTLRREEAVRDELEAVINLAFDQAPHVTVGLSGALRHVPLQHFPPAGNAHGPRHQHQAALRTPAQGRRVWDQPVPIRRSGPLRPAHRGAADRDHLEARPAAAERLLRGSDGGELSRAAGRNRTVLRFGNPEFSNVAI